MTSQEPLVVRLLGPFEVTVGDRPVAAGGPKQRAVLAALALRANRLVPTTELVDALWDPDSAGDKRHSLQQHVSSIRRLLTEAGVDEQVAITAEGPGYRMTVARTAVDVFTFDALRTTARVALDSGEPTKSVELLTEALDLWRGEALVDFVDLEWFSVQARAMSEGRLVAIEELIDARLGLGEHRALVGELEALVAAEPYRERLWAALMVALYRGDRQADALDAYRRARQVLVEELGIEPGEVLRSLESRILAQDRGLLAGTAAVTSGRGLDTAVEDGDRLAYLELPDGQQVHLGNRPVTIGRAPTASVRLNDTRVSRNHAVVEVQGSRYVVRDLESTNGTEVNGVRVAVHPLSEGDELSVGGVALRFRLPSLDP